MFPCCFNFAFYTSQVNSEFQAFKHIEMLAPGEFMRASESLEATLAIHPTLVLTNALPYVMEVIVWQVITHHACGQTTMGCWASGF